MLIRPLQQRWVGLKEQPNLTRHRERNVLILTVRRNIKLSFYPLLGRFGATREHVSTIPFPKP